MGLNDGKQGVWSFVRNKLEIFWSIGMTVVPTVSE
jgi:hypothetical protein